MPIRQVLVEAVIVVARIDASNSLGIDWQLLTGGQTSEGSGSEGLAVTAGQQLTANLNLVFFNDRARLNLALNAMAEAGTAEILSRPRLITGDRQTAVIKSGTRIPFQESAPNGRTAVRFQDAVLRLDVTPIITPDDKILLQLTINQDTPGATVSTGEGRATSIETTELRTRVLLEEGQTVALGGVFHNEQKQTKHRVPFLASLPLAGRLFQRTTSGKVKSETLIFITPHILPGE